QMPVLLQAPAADSPRFVDVRPSVRRPLLFPEPDADDPTSLAMHGETPSVQESHHLATVALEDASRADWDRRPEATVHTGDRASRHVGLAPHRRAARDG